MTHFKIIGWFWLVLGAFGFLWAFWQVYQFDFLGSLGMMALIDILQCSFAFICALAGFGLLRHWRWARIAVEILGSIVLSLSLFVLLGGEVIGFYVFTASLAFYSLLVAIFVKYEMPPNKSLQATAATPASSD
jgi:hypothetical protein